MFNAWWYDTDIDIGSPIVLAFDPTSSSDTVKMIIETGSTNDGIVQTFEDVAYSGGTGRACHNLNRSSSNGSNCSVVRDPTVSDWGTNVLSYWVNGVGMAFNVVLDTSKKYIFRFTPTADNTVGCMNIRWVERNDL